jgi:hypothetical protein
MMVQGQNAISTNHSLKFDAFSGWHYDTTLSLAAEQWQ